MNITTKQLQQLHRRYTSRPTGLRKPTVDKMGKAPVCVYCGTVCYGDCRAAQE